MILFQHDVIDISYQWIRTAKEKQTKKENSVAGIFEGDERGRHLNRPFKYPEIIKNDIREHIRKFPTMESHYCRENVQRKYVEEGLTLAKMYRMYVKESGKAEDDPMLASRSMYENIFREEFNYGFFIPKKDR